MKTAVYGGSFDPIHVGHSMVASSVLRAGAADEVWFMVSPCNPLKQGRRMTPERLRLEMARCVAERCEGLTASDFEFSLPRPSYTLATLRALRDAYPDRDFTLLIGADNWRLFGEWRGPEEILQEFGVIVFPRPGDPLEKGFWPSRVKRLEERVRILNDIPQCFLSSSEIRRLRREGKDVTFLVDPRVEELIVSHNLYTTEE